MKMIAAGVVKSGKVKRLDVDPMYQDQVHAMDWALQQINKAPVASTTEAPRRMYRGTASLDNQYPN